MKKVALVSKKLKRESPPQKDLGSLVDQAYERIRENIILLRFLPGQYLNEATICQTLNLGRTPVHQALQLLQRERLVEILPRKGIVVQPDGAAEILKILESRLVIEPFLAEKTAARSAAGEIESQTLDMLVELAAVPDETADPPDIDEFIDNDRSFHSTIAGLSGNSMLGDFAVALHERSCRFWYLNLWQTINVEVSKNSHMAIATAIGDGKVEDAGRAMRDHIQDLSERLKRLPRNAFGRTAEIEEEQVSNRSRSAAGGNR